MLFVTSEQTRCFTIHMVECRFGCPKTCEEEETCVASVIRMSTRYKTKRAAGIFDDWRRARFRKVATLKPGGLFKHYDLHKAESLEVSLVKKDALSLHLFKKLPNHQRKDIQPKRYTILCAEYAVSSWERMRSRILILSMLWAKDAVVLLYMAFVIIHFDALIRLHSKVAVNKLPLKCIATLWLN